VVVGIVVFPGSNCDHDCYQAVSTIAGLTPKFIWHKETDLSGIGAIILPGGFSYGDYLRAGAIARFSSVMNAVVEFAQKGGPILGICNGFQILTEAGLLPGTLMTNSSLRFICQEIHLKPISNKTFITQTLPSNYILTLPIAHKMGNYYADSDTLKMLEEQGQIVFRYCDSDGNLSSEANPNGSLNHIAGICDKTGRILGMMPHPERRVQSSQGGTDGGFIFSAIKAFANAGR
jgi:phosphoribosylformylglycinamidine synthase